VLKWGEAGNAALAYVSGDEFELIHQPDLTRRESHAKAFRIEAAPGARAGCFTGSDEPTCSPSQDRVFKAPICAPVPQLDAIGMALRFWPGPLKTAVASEDMTSAPFKGSRGVLGRDRGRIVGGGRHAISD
jgi:hypothetical protein